MRGQAKGTSFTFPRWILVLFLTYQEEARGTKGKMLASSSCTEHIYQHFRLVKTDGPLSVPT